MKKRTFNKLLIAHTEPSPKRITKSEMRRLGLEPLTKRQLDSMFVVNRKLDPEYRKAYAALFNAHPHFKKMDV